MSNKMALPANLQVHAHFQPEEAAHAAAELISSLDNLPGEVVFLLEEIREKDVRINQLIQRISTRHTSLTKSAKNLQSLPPSNLETPSSPSVPGPGSSGSIPMDHLPAKDQQALTKIQAEWIKVENLQDEKLKLAERIERIINRAKERAKFEWVKVGGKEIQHSSILDNSNSILSSDALGKPLVNGLPLGPGSGLGELGHNELVLPPTGLGSGSDGRPQKKRKPNTLSFPSPSSSLSQSLSMPPPLAPIRPSISARSSANHRSYSSNNPRHSSVAALSDADADGEDVDIDMDAEGEVDTIDNGQETGEGETDDTLYCTCQQKSYGEMIGCDNDGCEFEWFHVKCVNISGTLPDTWYCPDCVKKLGLLSSDGKMAGSNRKSRKK